MHITLNMWRGEKECEAWAKDYIEEMSEKVLMMVKISVDSLRKLDIPLAKTISETELEVDKMYFDYLHRLIGAEQA